MSEVSAKTRCWLHEAPAGYHSSVEAAMEATSAILTSVSLKQGYQAKALVKFTPGEVLHLTGSRGSRCCCCQ